MKTQFAMTYEDFLNALSFKAVGEMTIQESLEDQNHHSLFIMGELPNLKFKKDAWGIADSLKYTCNILCYNDYIINNLDDNHRQALISIRDSLYMTLIRTLRDEV